MIPTISRQELIDRYPKVSEDIIFIPERDLPKGVQLTYFIEVFPLNLPDEGFWDWNSNYLKGYVRCMASGEDDEIWGFTDIRDITLFLLRWS